LEEDAADEDTQEGDFDEQPNVESTTDRMYTDYYDYDYYDYNGKRRPDYMNKWDTDDYNWDDFNPGDTQDESNSVKKPAQAPKAASKKVRPQPSAPRTSKASQALFYVMVLGVIIIMGYLLLKYWRGSTRSRTYKQLHNKEYI